MAYDGPAPGVLAGDPAIVDPEGDGGELAVALVLLGAALVLLGASVPRGATLVGPIAAVTADVGATVFAVVVTAFAAVVGVATTWDVVVARAELVVAEALLSEVAVSDVAASSVGESERVARATKNPPIANTSTAPPTTARRIHAGREPGPSS